MNVPSEKTNETESPTPPKIGPIHAISRDVRAKILGGLIAALPIVLTLFIVNWLYVTLTTVVLTPAIEAVRFILGSHGMGETFWYRYFTPVFAIALVLFLLYALGVFVKLRVLLAVDLVCYHVPVVSIDFQGAYQCLSIAGKTTSRRVRVQTCRARRIPAARNALAGLCHQHASRCDHWWIDPLRYRIDGRDAPVRVHPIRPGRARDRHRMVNERDAPGDSIRGHHFARNHPLFSRAAQTIERPDPRPQRPSGRRQS